MNKKAVSYQEKEKLLMQMQTQLNESNVTTVHGSSSLDQT